MINLTAIKSRGPLRICRAFLASLSYTIFILFFLKPVEQDLISNFYPAQQIMHAA